MKKIKTSSTFKQLVKSGVSLVLSASLLLGSNTVLASDGGGTQADDFVNIEISRGVNIYINDNIFKTYNVKGNEVIPFIYDGTTYLPIRAISEIFGATVSWDDATKSVYIETKENEITSTENDYVPKTMYKETVTAYRNVNLYINNELHVPENVKGNEVDVFLIDGTTYVPARYISNIYGVDIAWENSTKSVYIGEHIEKTPSEDKKFYNLSDEWNERIARGINLIPTLMPYSYDVGVSEGTMLSVYNYVKFKSFEIEDLFWETNDPVMSEYNDRLYEIYYKMSDLHDDVLNCLNQADCHNYLDYLENLPRDIKDENKNMMTADNMLKCIEFMSANVNRILEESSEENVQKYYQEIDAIYEEAINYYEKNLKGKTYSINF